MSDIFRKVKRTHRAGRGPGAGDPTGGEAVADALEKGGTLHIFDSGHMVSQELVHRAGGLAAINALTFQLVVGNKVRARADNAASRQAYLTRYIEHVFETNQLRAGDVLFVGSVSGKTANVIELALQATGAWVEGDRDDGDGVQLEAGIRASLRQAPIRGPPTWCSTTVLLTVTPCWKSKDWNTRSARPRASARLWCLWAVVAGIVEEMLARGLKPTVLPQRQPSGRARLLVGCMKRSAARKGIDGLPGTVIELLQEVRDTQAEAMEQAAQVMAEAIQAGTWCMSSGLPTPASWLRSCFTAPGAGAG